MQSIRSTFRTERRDPHQLGDAPTHARGAENVTANISAPQMLALNRCVLEGLSWESAAAVAEVSEPTVGRYFKALKEAGIPRGTPRFANDDRVTPVDIPPEVLADRQRRLSLAPQSIVAAIAGDPLPAYSALDRR
jgi:hypothetical protein